MIRGKNQAFAIPQSSLFFFAAALGAGASAPTLPKDGNFTPTTATYPLRANGLSTVTAPTRTSAGLYVLTISHLLPNILNAAGSVLSAGASPTAALKAIVTIVNAPSKTVTVLVTTPSGTATDLGTSDMLVLTLHAQDSTV